MRDRPRRVDVSSPVAELELRPPLRVRAHFAAVATLAGSAALARVGQFVTFAVFAASAPVDDVAAVLTALTVLTIAEFLGDGGTRVRAGREWALEDDSLRRESAAVRLTRARDRVSLMFALLAALTALLLGGDVAMITLLGVPLVVTFNRVQLWTVIAQSSNRWRAVATMEAISGVGSLAGFLVLRTLTDDVFAIVAAISAAQVVAAVVGRQMLVRRRLEVSTPNFPEILSVYRGSADVYSVQLLEMLFVRFDLIIVASIASARVTAAYGIATKLAEASRSMTVQLTTVARTALQTTAARERNAPSERDVARWFAVVAGGTLVATTGVMVVTPHLARLFGQVDPTTIRKMATILLIAEIPLLCQSLLHYVQVGIVDDRRLPLWPSIAALGTYLVVLTSGIAVGTAASPAVASLVAYLVSFTLYARRQPAGARAPILLTTGGATILSATVGAVLWWAT